MLHSRTRLLRLVTLLGLATVLAGTVVSTRPALRATAEPATPSLAQAAPDFDIRDSLAPVGRARTPGIASLAGVPDVSVTWNDRQAVPSSVIRYGGYLTEASDQAPEAVVRGYLAANAALFGLGANDLANFVVDSQPTSDNGVTQLVMRQVDAGRPVYGSSLLFSVDRQGRLLTMGGAYFPGAAATSPAALSPEAAVETAASKAGAALRAPLTRLAEEPAPLRRVTFDNTVADPAIQNVSPVTAEMVTFPMLAGMPARLGWRTVTEVSEVGWYESVVDASTGELLYRQNYYQDDAQGTVYPGESPLTSTRQVVSFAGDPAFDSAGWVGARTTSGNNVNTYQDLNNTNTVGFQPVTPDAPDPGFQHFDFPFTNAYGLGNHTDVTTDASAVVTQEFYYNNVIHDYLYRLGFTESFRNFQVDNFGRGGLGNDAVNAESDDGFNIGRRNNANFATPPDGRNPRMQMFVFTAPPFAFTDGDLDADVVFHEYTHGLSNRLVGGGVLGSGVQTGAMGEGWSDSIAATVNGNAVIGEYVTGNLQRGIRRFSYDNSPLRYGDLCNQGCEVHRDGEIWATTLWDMRTRLIQKLGAAAGKHTHELLLVDGMKSTVSRPSFLQARDGILAADMADNAGANQCLIWGVFAARQMGRSAASSTDQRTVTPATDVPANCVATLGLASSANPSVTGQTVTLSATVTGGGTSGQGTVTFSEGSTALGTAALDGAGTAAVSTSALAVGTHTITAIYNGDGNLSPATTSLVQTVAPDATTTVVSPSANPSTFGQPVTFTITVTANAPGSGTPSGSVTLRDGSVPLATTPLDAGARASVTTASLQAGTHTITASYSGDASYLASTSAGLQQAVACTSNITGVVLAGLDVTTSTCLAGATIRGSVSVQPGAALSLTDTRIDGGLRSTGATAVTACGSSIAGATTITGTTGFVLLGDGKDDGDLPCAGNTLAGSVALDDNGGQLEVGGSTLMGGLSVTNTSGAGPNPGHPASEIEGNTIRGALDCAGNTPAPTNDGQPNAVTGARLGQCSAPGF